MPLHPIPLPDSVWRASALGTGMEATVSSGHAALDTVLPGAGWPCGSLSEILQAQSGVHEWRLLLPALRAVAGTVVLVGSPLVPHLPALACQGVAMHSVLWIDTDRPADQLWAAEQALRCRDVGALLAWLPQARPGQLRRLQLAAQTANQPQAPLVFAFRPLDAQHAASPAPLRIHLAGAPGHRLALDIFKRRGPTLGRPVLLSPALPPALAGRTFLTPPPTPVARPLYVVDRPRTAATA